MKKQKLLLLKDVESLGRSGDVVLVRAGYGRNYLMPLSLAIFADERTIELQEKLKAERLKKAELEKKEAEEMAGRFTDFTLEIKVKVDAEGNLYGSVAAHEIADLLKERGFHVERSNIVLARPIKSLGTHKVSLKFKEGVTASFSMEVLAE